MDKQEAAIVVKDLSKTFNLPHEQQSGIKQMAVGFFRHKRGFETQKVLDGISFEIKKGEFFGIVGRNGSGKSTLLKLLAGIYTPDSGAIRVNGTLTSFIELGVGFNPELTGRENVYLNGALLGFDRQQMDEMYEDIVSFAELDRFMDQKLKNYSSGMQVRLAFSIAVRADNDILILDEVLAVGDEAFQKKCVDYFTELKRRKKTIILVTHDMASVERFCDRALMIDKGKLRLIGPPKKVSYEYSELNQTAREVELQKINEARYGDDYILRLLNAAEKPANSFDYEDELILDISWKDPTVQHVGVALIKQTGEYVFGPNTYQEGYDLGDSKHLQ
ncbi:ATP-binding cassette domain-containing protein [Candidatus Saccharibacteria bacterium]|nr:MAG: ATP-binding cassette domain-containing protein [Candidatus Saccharibacteria bacterium]